ncbi:glycosyltransferase [Candidatus Sumerlaeota bacterium]|nr:glycosyltransferase [Candidatus Sumerlaeota bacterium]
MTDQQQPKVSIVIASVNGPVCLRECLESLTNQDGNISAEIIVADCCGDATARMVAEQFPGVDFTQFQERRTIPELRAFGMLRSKGEIVAITEDHCIAPRDWFQQMVKAHETHDCDAAGGAIENAAIHRIIDWAVFFCEYLRYMNPIPEGYTHDIPGNNASYKRPVLEVMRDLLEGGYWEGFLHARLVEKQKKIYCSPAMVILHKKSFGFGEFLSQRYHYGKSYAGMRNEISTPAKRLFYIVFSPLLPPVLVYRMVKLTMLKKRFRKEAILSIPYLLTFSLFWAAGEFMGYVFGPGDSLAKVE